jgi:hypothetical protein
MINHIYPITFERLKLLTAWSKSESKKLDVFSSKYWTRYIYFCWSTFIYILGRKEYIFKLNQPAILIRETDVSVWCWIWCILFFCVHLKVIYFYLGLWTCWFLYTLFFHKKLKNLRNCSETTSTRWCHDIMSHIYVIKNFVNAAWKMMLRVRLTAKNKYLT